MKALFTLLAFCQGILLFTRGIHTRGTRDAGIWWFLLLLAYTGCWTNNRSVCGEAMSFWYELIDPIHGAPFHLCSGYINSVTEANLISVRGKLDSIFIFTSSLYATSRYQGQGQKLHRTLSLECNYLSLPLISASGTYVHVSISSLDIYVWIHMFVSAYETPQEQSYGFKKWYISIAI